MIEELSPFCANYSRMIEVIGKKWSGAVLWALIAGRKRFNDIGGVIPGISDRLLSERLKELEAEGLITRTVTPTTPVLVEYALTPDGRTLQPILQQLERWAEKRSKGKVTSPKRSGATTSPSLSASPSASSSSRRR